MTVKITIVTPSYNQGVFLQRTLDSVLNQNIDHLEYLVFDGGSTDESVSILERYRDRVSFVSEKDGGQSDAVNKGMLAARGEIIGWLNSDDVYYPGAINSVLEIFDQHPEVEVVYGNADHIDVSDGYMEDYYTEQWDYDRLKEICFICQPAVFFRKSVVERYGSLNKGLRYCMDYEYWLRIGAEKPFFYLNRKLAGSRLYMDNKTLGSRRQVHIEIIEMLKTKFGKAPERWIYNLAHVIVEEEGYTRKDHSHDSEFVKKLSKVSLKLFLKYNKSITVKQLKTILTWYRQALKASSKKGG